MKEVLNNSPERSKRTVRTLAVSVMASLALAGAPESSSAEIERVVSPKALSVAKKIKQRIVRKESIRFEANYDVYWHSSGSFDYDLGDYRTDVPIKARVGRGYRFFDLEQTGRSLRSLKVLPIPNPERVIKAQSPLDSYYHCGIQPSERDVVELNRKKQPVVDINYDNFEHERVRLGRTTPFDGRVILIPPPIIRQDCPPDSEV